MSTIKVSAIQDLSGGQNVNVPNAAKAWVNFNGTGTVAIRGSFNVSSITDHGVGDYTANFTNALADADYSFCLSNQQSPSFASIMSQALAANPQTTSIRIICYKADYSASLDLPFIAVAIFR